MACSEHVLQVTEELIEEERRFTTLQAAVEAARRMREPGESCRIVLGGGTYFVDEPVCLDERDNGLIIEGAAGESITLCGGRRIEGWRQEGDQLWVADVPAAGNRMSDFRTLAVNGRCRARARLPGQGYFYHTNDADPAPSWQRGEAGTHDYAEYTTLAYNPDDLGPDFDAANAEVRVYHSWDESLVRVADLDANGHVMTLYPPCVYPPGTFGRREFVVWNTREGMTQPGQWYLDRTAGKIVYWPLPGEEPDAIEAVVPELESILQIHGSATAPVKSVMVRNLTFTATKSCLTNEKLLEMIAPSETELSTSIGVGGRNSEGALSMRHSDACVLAGLTFRQIGGQAIKGRDVRDCRIVACDIEEIGAAGIHLDNVDGADISNNRVRAIGRLFPSANAVLVTQSDNAILRHNEISDAPYSGISLHTCKNASICSNRIDRVMQEIDDGGGIYVAFGERVVVASNSISDFADSDRYERNMRHAYYFDVGCLHCLLEGNLAQRCSSFTHVHMAAQVAVRDNIFVSDGPGAVSFRRSADCVFERNVVQAQGDLEVHDLERQIVHRNILCSRAGRIIALSTLEPDRTEGDLRIEASNVHVDPAVEEARQGRFCVSSPELSAALDLKPVNVASAGRTDAHPMLFTFNEDVRESRRQLYPVLVEGMRRHGSDSPG